MNRSFGHLLTVISILLPATGCGRDAGPVKVASFGPVRMGAPIPDFAGVSGSGVPLGPTAPPGRFYVHLVNDRLPPSCLDEECGQSARSVVADGGHVIGGSDGKYAKALGVALVSAKPWKLAPSVLIVTDAGGRVTAIWKGAEEANLAAIMREERVDRGAGVGVTRPQG